MEAVIKKRNINLDIIRDIAFFLLVSIHFFLNTGFYETAVNCNRMYVAVALRTISMLCIPLFLILTGYLKLEKEYNKKYYSSLIKIIIIYILSMIVNYTFFHYWENKNLFFRSMINDILSFRDSAWYIDMYIGLFLLSPFLNKLFLNLSTKEQKILIISLFAIVTLPTLLNIWNFNHGLQWFKHPSMDFNSTKLVPDWWGKLYPLLYYFIGCYLKRNTIKLKTKSILILLIASICISIIFNIYWSYNSIFGFYSFTDWGGWQNVISATLLVMLLTRLKLDFIKEPIAKIITKISTYSLSAYLVSPIFERIVYKILNSNVDSFVLRLNYWFVSVIIIASLSIIASIIINYIYKLLSKFDMKFVFIGILIIIIVDCAIAKTVEYYTNYYKWSKYSNSPIVGDRNTGTLFDPCILYDNGLYKLYVSKRIDSSIVLYESEDGINFNKEYVCVLKPESNQFIINRAAVLKKDDTYFMYYTEQWGNEETYDYKFSSIFLATSKDGINFETDFNKPVLTFTEDYEKTSVMNPNVIYDEDEKIFKMYYVAGEIFEPDVICYATSRDGINWDKYESNPILKKNEDNNALDCYKVGAVDVKKINDIYYMFYIGYTDLYTARVFLAESTDGINWNRDSYNPIIEPTEGTFDASAVYKPSAEYDYKNNRWLLYYNGRNGSEEYIGLAIKNGNITDIK